MDFAHVNLQSFEDVRDEKLHSRINKAHLSVCLWRRTLGFAGASVVLSIFLLQDGEKI